MTKSKALLPYASFLAVMIASLILASETLAQELPKPIGEEAFGVLKAFYDYDATIPLEARVVELKDEKTSVRRKIVFRSTRGFLVPGLLEVPKGVEAPYPCVLLMHGWSGSKDSWWEDRGYTRGKLRETLLKKGYAIYALDAQGHGDRIAENDYHPVNLHNEPGEPPRKNYFTIREVIAQTVVDYRRGLDYLAARGDIDMERMGLVGYSMGGFHAFALTATEPRITLAVGCVVPTSLSDDPVLAPANYARGIGDRAFCMLMGREDEMCKEAQARELYALIEGPNTELVLYDAGHFLPTEFVADAIDFVTGKL